MILAGHDSFPEDYVRKAEGMKDSNAYITIKYALERPVIEHPGGLLHAGDAGREHLRLRR